MAARAFDSLSGHAARQTYVWLRKADFGVTWMGAARHCSTWEEVVRSGCSAVRFCARTRTRFGWVRLRWSGCGLSSQGMGVGVRLADIGVRVPDARAWRVQAGLVPARHGSAGRGTTAWVRLSRLDARRFDSAARRASCGMARRRRAGLGLARFGRTWKGAGNGCRVVRFDSPARGAAWLVLAGLGWPGCGIAWQGLGSSDGRRAGSSPARGAISYDTAWDRTTSTKRGKHD